VSEEGNVVKVQNSAQKEAITLEAWDLQAMLVLRYMTGRGLLLFLLCDSEKFVAR
jgi:hypothetical protein